MEKVISILSFFEMETSDENNLECEISQRWMEITKVYSISVSHYLINYKYQSSDKSVESFSIWGIADVEM